MKQMKKLDGLPHKQRKEFVEQMQKVTMETINASVDNHITLESEPGFTNSYVKIIALCGAKEQDEVKNSIIGMSRLNSHCSYEIWDKAAHNIPPMFANKFNLLIEDCMN